MEINFNIKNKNINNSNRNTPRNHPFPKIKPLRNKNKNNTEHKIMRKKKSTNKQLKQYTLIKS